MTEAPENDDDDEKNLNVLLKSVAAVYSNFSKMDVWKYYKEVVTDGYIEVICYCQWCFNVEIWTKLNFGIKFYLLARTGINGLG